MKKTSYALFLAMALSVLCGCTVLQDAAYDQNPVTDVEIAALAMSRLNNDVMTGRATLSVGVQNGLATIYGSVPDHVTRERAIQIVQGTLGVTGVRDHTRRQ
ncbi:MAG: BON domain-containing protein [Lentisphaerae bacterium]|nr:BON domain-containing protein [Lentisphaerota bacterium]